MAFVSLEETARQAPVSIAISAADNLAEVMRICRNECKNVEALAVAEQFNVLTAAEKRLNVHRERCLLADSLANSVVFHFHAQQFESFLPELRQKSRTGDARYFDMCHYAGTHNFFGISKHGSLTEKGFSDQAVWHLNDAIKIWPRIVEAGEDWHYRQVAYAWACLRMNTLDPSGTLIMDKVVCALNKAAENRVMNLKDHRQFSKCISFALNMATAPKNPHLAEYAHSLSELAYLAREREIAGR